MNKLIIWWSYGVELVASGLILLLVCMWLSSEEVVSFFRVAALDIATLFGGVMLAGALAFLWTFFSKADTPFYRWLDEKGAFKVYLAATSYTVAVSFLSTASLVVTKYVQNSYVTLASVFLLLLAIINLYTLVINVGGLMQLNTLFMRSENTKNRSQ